MKVCDRNLITVKNRILLIVINCQNQGAVLTVGVVGVVGVTSFPSSPQAKINRIKKSGISVFDKKKERFS